jgi:Fic/DOC family N-terminal
MGDRLPRSGFRHANSEVGKGRQSTSWYGQLVQKLEFEAARGLHIQGSLQNLEYGTSAEQQNQAFPMNRLHLAPDIRRRLKRYPKPFDNHYGVVPLPPTEDAVDLGAFRAALASALESIGRADTLAKSYPDHFLLSRVLVRQEAVTSSAIEGTYSTLDPKFQRQGRKNTRPYCLDRGRQAYRPVNLQSHTPS